MRNSPESYGIHWFRRDLRVSGNPALEWSLSEHRGRVLALFCFDPTFLTRPDFSHDRFQFFLESLKALRHDLQSQGGDLLVLDQAPTESLRRLFEELNRKKIKLPNTVSFNRDYEPFARTRDANVEGLCELEFGIKTHTERDHLVIEPEELVKNGKEQGFYQVYTPFARRWLEIFSSKELERRSSSTKTFRLTWKQLFVGKVPYADALNQFVEENSKKVRVPIPAAGATAALKAVEEFKRVRLKDYPVTRDFPSVMGTSQLSIYLKNGSLTTTQVIAALDLKPGDRFLSQLIWREFYYHILWHVPRVEHEAFIEKYKMIKWENDEKRFEAWKEGRTGYPIVDAGMRQLNQTGWMHNRLRMIVASFLTKDLLIDWRWGERYFMERLLDGDLALNNGGWQWAASTGCDPQPYFRIFSPMLQSKRFDPQCEYIHKWVPELKGHKVSHIHSCQNLAFAKYPAPIVDHSIQREKALRLYNGIKKDKKT